MSDFNTFPSAPVEAIAYLYVQTQDLTGKTPVQIYEMYLDALSDTERPEPKEERRLV